MSDDIYALAGAVGELRTSVHAAKMLGSGEMNAETARGLIADHLAVEVQAVRDDAHFSEDLGADSLDMIELAMRFEEALDVSIGDEESEACATVRDALDLLRRKIGSSETV